MNVNIFEGARRIQFLLLLAVGALGVWLAWETSSGLERNYDVVLDRNGAISFQGIQECRAEDSTRYYSQQLKSGAWIRGDLCYRTFVAQSGERVVLNRIDQQGRQWGAPIYSSETMDLQRRADDAFTVPTQDLPRINKDIRKKLWKSRVQILGYTVITMGALWLVGLILGWIVRGFLGIPNGRDRRPERAAQTNDPWDQ
jgi:hypothetical protein